MGSLKAVYAELIHLSMLLYILDLVWLCAILEVFNVVIIKCACWLRCYCQIGVYCYCCLLKKAPLSIRFVYNYLFPECDRSNFGYLYFRFVFLNEVYVPLVISLFSGYMSYEVYLYLVCVYLF